MPARAEEPRVLGADALVVLQVCEDPGEREHARGRPECGHPSTHRGAAHAQADIERDPRCGQGLAGAARGVRGREGHELSGTAESITEAHPLIEAELRYVTTARE